MSYDPESFDHQSIIVLDSSKNFDHLVQRGGVVEGSLFFDNPFRIPGSGICWAIALSEAIASLIGDQKTLTVLDKVGRLMFETFPHNFGEIMGKASEYEGGFPPFMEKAIPLLVDKETGGLYRIQEKFPVQMANLLTHLLREMGGFRIKIIIPPESTLAGYHPFDALGQRYKPGVSVPIASINIQSPGQKERGHMVFVAGIKKSGRGVCGVLISDPDVEKMINLEIPPVVIAGDSKNWKYVVGSPKEATKISLATPPFIWVEKEN